jgi:hypothetical protein
LVEESLFERGGCFGVRKEGKIVSLGEIFANGAGFVEMGAIWEGYAGHTAPRVSFQVRRFLLVPEAKLGDYTMTKRQNVR